MTLLHRVFMWCFHAYLFISNVLCLRFLSWKRGGVMDLVYGSSSSSYMDFEVNFVYECYDSPIWSSFNTVLLCQRLRRWPRHTWLFLIHGSTTFRMSTRRLPVILFVFSFRVTYILLFFAWCAYGGRGGLLFNCAWWRVNILRLFHSLLLIILLPPPP